MSGDGFGLDFSATETLSEDFRLAYDELEQAAMAAADAVADWGKQRWRNEVRDAGLGDRVANTIRERIFPDRGSAASVSPTISWSSKAPHIVRAFEEGLTIRAGDTKWLVIPTENAPKRARVVGIDGRIRRGRNYLIVQAERQFGRLNLIKVPGKNMALLTARRLRRRRGKRGGYAPASASALKRRDYEDSVVLFVLVPAVKMPRRLDRDEIERAIGAEGLERFARALADVIERNFGPEGAP
ncbi:hypothetical protein FKB34_01820 [Glycocaulis profundi]|nr:hypothetical protein FKB34_01820 [Glycocaulis profundi]